MLARPIVSSPVVNDRLNPFMKPLFQGGNSPPELCPELVAHSNITKKRIYVVDEGRKEFSALYLLKHIQDPSVSRSWAALDVIWPAIFH